MSSEPRRVRVEPNIYKRPRDGKYEITTRDAGGVKRWVTVDGGIMAARKRLAIEKAKSAKGEVVPVAPRLTFGVAADSWWEATILRTRPASHRAYANHLRHLRQEFGSVRLSAITSSLVAEYVERGRAAPSVIRGRLIVLGAIFKHAARRLGYRGDNPVRLLERGELPASQETVRRILTDEELAALLDAVPELHRLLFDTMAQTGLRISEARGLIWANFNPDAGTLTVDGQLSRGSERIPPKSRQSYRTIAIAPSLVARLREYRLATGRPSDRELIFRHPERERGVRGLWKIGSGGRLRSYASSTISGIILDARAQAGLGPIMRGREVIARAPAPHDLRHTHASRLIAAGWDPVEVAARLGDQIQTVLKVYAHEWDAARRRSDQGDRLEAIYGTAMEPADQSPAQQSAAAAGGEIVDLQGKRSSGLSPA
jgi:integrase